ncbi:glycosyl hydrolase family 18 protein [Planctomycetota bacterium]
MKNLVKITLAVILVLMCVNLQAKEEKNSKQEKSKIVSQKRLKGQRIVSPWFVGNGCSIEQLLPNADIIGSLSLFCTPSEEFIRYCHEHNIETYLAVSGGADVFSTAKQRQNTIKEYLSYCSGPAGVDGIDLDLEHLDTKYKDTYSIFLREVSAALHKAGKKLAICVGYYPPMYKDKLVFWYDPKVIGRTCDMVRVMCYDMYYAPGKGNEELMDRGDCQGIGPTSTSPWAREAMQFWLRYVPSEKLIMGLPAYSNDYDLAPNGKGTQVEAPRPNSSVAKVFDKTWLPYEQINMYRYLDDQGHLHIFYASDTKSTVAHLETVDDLNIGGISFWYYQAVPDETWTAVCKWLKD